MEFLKELDDNRAKPNPASGQQGQTDHRAGRASRFPAHLSAGPRPLHARAASTPVSAWHSMPSSPARPTERSPLTRSYSSADIEELGENMEYTGSGPVAGGTIMGIHNLAIVFPQFVVSPAILLARQLADIIGRTCCFFNLQISRWGRPTRHTWLLRWRSSRRDANSQDRGDVGIKIRRSDGARWRIDLPKSSAYKD